MKAAASHAVADVGLRLRRIGRPPAYGERLCYVGSRNACDGRGVLRDRHRVCEGLRASVDQGVGQMIEAALLIAVIVLLMAYLVFALLRPEKF
jgi:K+-transporting ATPase KdpF subunit